MPDQTEIIPGLWMGGQTDTNLQTDFDAVVDCRQEEDTCKDVMGNNWIFGDLPKGTLFLWCPMIDGPVLPEPWKIAACVDVIKSTLQMSPVPTKVLVHCTMGMNRSGLIVAAYMVGGLRYPRLPADAIAEIRRKRPGALSNPTFVDYLMSLKP